MRTIVSLVLIALILQACVTKPFVHEEYPLKPEMIPAFQVVGQVTITNAQQSTNQVIVFSDGGVKLTSDLHTLTAGVVQQAVEELGRHGIVTNSPTPKTVGIKVLSLTSETAFWHWNSSMHVEACSGMGRQ